MDLQSAFIDHITAQQLFSPQDHLLIATSGGADSVALCELCHRAGFRFTILHCNFQLRGTESDRDEQFVRELANRYGVEVAVKTFDTKTYAQIHSLSIQEAARALRYQWFAACRGPYQQPSAPHSVYVLTAHHRDDNIETLLMHFFRGTGLHGLTGIPPRGASKEMSYLRRPLLPFPKTALLDFLSANGVEFVEDSSNQTEHYTRNYIRHTIIPAIEKVYPQVKDNLHDSIQRFTAIEKLYEQGVDHLRKKLCRYKGAEVHIPIKQFMSYQHTSLIYALLSPYGFSEKQVEEVLRLAQRESGKYITAASGSHRIIRHRHWFILAPVQGTGIDIYVIEENMPALSFAGGKLYLKVTAPGTPGTDPKIAMLDRSAISFPLLLRRWKPGDYFYPLGMKKKKKLARYFIDHKFSATEKEKVWVLESGQRIVWIVGHRIDDRFKLTAATKEVMQLTLDPQ